MSGVLVSPTKPRTLLLVVLLAASSAALGAAPRPGSAGSVPFANPAFERVWAASDQAVAAGEAQRSWLWGPAPFAYAQDLYFESPGFTRLVQYFDKSRMEINYPGSDASSRWYVTNGLLVKELVFGKKQVGESQFISGPAVQTPIAGDPTDSRTPTYTSFSRVASWDGNGRADDRTGQPVREWINATGDVSQGDAPSPVVYGFFEPALGHNIADVFWSWMNDPTNGILSYGDYVYPMGYPISEPFWLQATVAGVQRTILVQLFERRVLTYTPDNPAGWQVEMGNVGRAYVEWVYGAPRDSNPRWSPDGQRLLFTSNRDGNSDVFTIDADGSNLRQLTRTVEEESNARWHPDGSRIAFTRGSASYLMAADGSDLQPWRYAATQWAPNGQAFVYLKQAGNLIEARVQRVPGAAEQVVFSSNELPVVTTWSPDSRRLAILTLAQGQAGRVTLWVVEADGSQKWRVTPEAWNDLTNVSFSWAPDGERLTFFVTKQDRSVSPLYVVKADGSQLQTIAPAARSISPPSWSPDGAVILYQEPAERPTSLWVVKPDGTGATRLGDERVDQVRQFVWSPSGDRIVYTRELPSGGTELWLMNRDGSDAHLLDSPPGW